MEVLKQFEGKLDIHRAGKISWVGHSFGAATVTQLLKSVYYHGQRPPSAGNPLIAPNADAAILHQIMHESAVLLLDLWGLPLQSPDQVFLRDRPLPGENVLSVLSEAFYNWKANLNINKHIMEGFSELHTSSTAPQLDRGKGKLLPAWSRLQDQSPSRDSGYISRTSQSPSRSLSRHASQDSNHNDLSYNPSQNPNACQQPKIHGPYMFYVQRSQHFNQSDFGVLFPSLARRFTKAEEPERILELNTRAMVQVMREAGLEVAGDDDREILDGNNSIRSWVSMPLENRKGATTTSEALNAVNEKLSPISTNSDKGTEDMLAVA